MMHALHTRRLGNQRGMTLIEILLALAILATIMALTWGSVSQSFRFRTAALDKFDRYRTVQQSLDRMSREISMAFVTNIGQITTNERNEVTYLTTFDGRDDELTFTTLAHVRTRADAPTSEQCEITYRLERQRGLDGRMQQNLVRREDAPIDADPDEGGVLYTMLEDVESIRFEYWDRASEMADDAWLRAWDSVQDHGGKLPPRVRITIEVKHPLNDRETLQFTTQTQIAMTEPLVIIPADLLEIVNQIPEDCTNGRDDNADGNTDCNDAQCFENPICADQLAGENFAIGGDRQLREGDE